MFDLIVIGGGPAGYTGALRAAQLGLKTAVIEKDKTLGGTCLNVGCIPSKALLESSEHYSFIKTQSKIHGIQASAKLDLKQMLARKNSVVSDLTKGIEFLLKKNKISWIQGTATLKSNTEVQVKSSQKTQILEAKNIMLAPGSKPIELPFAPFDSKTVVSSTEALSFTQVPKTLTVIGGGFIGLELGSVWSRLGSKVTVIERAPELCSGMDKGLSKELCKNLILQGLDIKLESSVKKFESSKVFYIDKNNKEQSIETEKLLVCVGRKPNTADLGLENLKIQINSQGQIVIDENFQSSIPNIFAVGDAVRGPMLAHKAEEEGVAVSEYIATGFCDVNYTTVPSIIYTHPEVASVGKTEEELKDEKVIYNRGQFPFLANGRARSMQDTTGFVKVLADASTDKILGVHIIGPRAGDLIAEAVLAMEFEGTSEDLAHSFHAHPTLSEALREAALAVTKQARQI